MKRPGFSLIELLISVSILVIVFVSIFKLNSNTLFFLDITNKNQVISNYFSLVPINKEDTYDLSKIVSKFNNDNIRRELNNKYVEVINRNTVFENFDTFEFSITNKEQRLNNPNKNMVYFRIDSKVLEEQ